MKLVNLIYNNKCVLAYKIENMSCDYKHWYKCANGEMIMFNPKSGNYYITPADTANNMFKSIVAPEGSLEGKEVVNIDAMELEAILNNSMPF